MNGNKSIQEFVLVSKAPVETAVKLSKHFRILAMKEKVLVLQHIVSIMQVIKSMYFKLLM